MCGSVGWSRDYGCTGGVSIARTAVPAIGHESERHATTCPVLPDCERRRFPGAQAGPRARTPRPCQIDRFTHLNEETGMCDILRDTRRRTSTR